MSEEPKLAPDPHGMNAAPAPPPAAWWKTFVREQVHAQIEDALGEGVSVDDALADTLIATAQAMGMMPHELRLWILELPRHELTAERLVEWARVYGLDHSAAFAATRITAEELRAKVEGEKSE